MRPLIFFCCGRRCRERTPERLCRERNRMAPTKSLPCQRAITWYWCGSTASGFTKGSCTLSRIQTTCRISPWSAAAADLLLLPGGLGLAQASVFLRGVTDDQADHPAGQKNFKIVVVLHVSDGERQRYADDQAEQNSGGQRMYFASEDSDQHSRNHAFDS